LFKNGISIIKRNIHSPLSSIFTIDSDKQHLLYPVIKRGKGPYIYDYDGNRYVDFYLSNGSLLLGHTHPGITKIIKSWLNREYAAGYRNVSHEMLSRRLSSILENNSLKWMYFNSSYEAFNVLIYFLKAIPGKKNGVYISNKKKVMPFNQFNIKELKSLDNLDCSTIDFLIIKFQKGMDIKYLKRIKELSDSGKLIISDETDLESTIHLLNYKDRLKYIKIRIFGNYISSGLEFGAICFKSSFLANLSNINNLELFDRASLFNAFPPLYKIKAAIAFLGLIKTLGGIGGLLKINRKFFDMLNKSYFSIENNLIYIKDSFSKEKNFIRLRSILIKKGFYFPISINNPIFISYSHSEELLQKSSEAINSVFNLFFRYKI